MKILITGCAGFIGFHLTKNLGLLKHEIIAIDDLNDYYSIDLKITRLKELGINTTKDNDKKCQSTLYDLTFFKLNIANNEAIDNLFTEHQFEIVINLAAQAGVRYSIENPRKYIESNQIGFFNILQASKDAGVGHFIYASSSSVYGLNTKMPLSVQDSVAHPISLYAATKRSNELLAHSYSHLYNLPTTGLRFFTVYGPWGRPDMSYSLFTKAILNNEPIKIFNHGKMLRDFTFVDDIVEAISKLLSKAPSKNNLFNSENPNPSISSAPFRIFNIGNNKPNTLMEFIEILEDCIGKTAQKEYLPLQAGDVLATFANIDELDNLIGFKPKTSLKEGLSKYVTWHKSYYN